MEESTLRGLLGFLGGVTWPVISLFWNLRAMIYLSTGWGLKQRHFTAQASFGFTGFKPWTLECWDYRCLAPHPAQRCYILRRKQLLHVGIGRK